MKKTNAAGSHQTHLAWAIVAKKKHKTRNTEYRNIEIKKYRVTDYSIVNVTVSGKIYVLQSVGIDDEEYYMLTCHIVYLT